MTTEQVVNDDGGVMTRVSALDGVRGLAVLLVFLYHAGQPLVGGLLLQSGVDLFFVLSGFLITTILLRTVGRDDYFRNFYGRRTARIFPLYYLVLAVFLVLAWAAVRWGFAHDIGFPEAQNLIDNQLWGWLYQVNNLEALYGEQAFAGLAHLWSLSIEEQFYLVWPAVLALLARRRVRLLPFCLVAALASMVFRCVTYFVVGRDFAYYFTFCRLDALLIGAAGAVVLADPELRQRFRPAIEWFGRNWWAPFLLLLMPEQAGLYLGFTFLAIGYLGLVLATNEGVLAPRPTRWMEHRFFQQLGKYSYAIYIFSLPISRVANEVSPSNIELVDVVFRLVTVGALSYGLARLSWVCWERPWLRLKRRFSYS